MHWTGPDQASAPIQRVTSEAYTCLSGRGGGFSIPLSDRRGHGAGLRGLRSAPSSHGQRGRGRMGSAPGENRDWIVRTRPGGAQGLGVTPHRPWAKLTHYLKFAQLAERITTLPYGRTSITSIRPTRRWNRLPTGSACGANRRRAERQQHRISPLPDPWTFGPWTPP